MAKSGKSQRRTPTKRKGGGKRAAGKSTTAAASSVGENDDLHDDLLAIADGRRPSVAVETPNEDAPEDWPVGTAAEEEEDQWLLERDGRNVQQPEK
jgi:hypothetical protein